jgi:hypothetical protein
VAEHAGVEVEQLATGLVAVVQDAEGPHGLQQGRVQLPAGVQVVVVVPRDGQDRQVGTWVQILFYALAIVSLYATALGLLDVIGRLGSDFIRRNYLADSTRWTESRLYVLIVWAEIVLGSIILLSGVTQPLVLLIISTCAASIVTLFYSILIVRLNIRDLPDPIRLRGARLAGMIVAICFYGFFAVGLLVTQLQKL